MPGTRGPVPVPAHSNGVQDLTSQILTTLDSQEPINTAETFPQASQGEVKAALDRLASRGMVQYQTNDTEQVVLTSTLR